MFLRKPKLPKHAEQLPVFIVNGVIYWTIRFLCRSHRYALGCVLRRSRVENFERQIPPIGQRRIKLFVFIGLMLFLVSIGYLFTDVLEGFFLLVFLAGIAFYGTLRNLNRYAPPAD